MWTEEEMAAYERCWPIGTRQRVWLDVLAYTGLRRGDAVRGGAMASHYTREANRVRLAKEGMHKLANES
jgi:hypothetical protein